MKRSRKVVGARIFCFFHHFGRPCGASSYLRSACPRRRRTSAGVSDMLQIFTSFREGKVFLQSEACVWWGGETKRRDPNPFPPPPPIFPMQKRSFCIGANSILSKYLPLLGRREDVPCFGYIGGDAPLGCARGGSSRRKLSKNKDATTLLRGFLGKKWAKKCPGHIRNTV